MEITAVACNKCGASLDVGEGARFVTCRYCGAQLEIKRTDSAVYTEALERIDHRTAEMAEDLGAIRRETEIERLDREWAQRREELMVRGKDGRTSRPSTGGGLVTIFVGGGFGLFWTIMAFSITSGAAGMGAPGIVELFPLFGVVFIVGSIIAGVSMMGSSQTFDAEEAAYQRRRSELLAGSERPQEH